MCYGFGQCSGYVTADTLNQVVQALVLSHLNYCSVIWSSVAKKDMWKLQIAQNKAARLALNCSVHTNVLNMHRNLSWLPVENRLKVSLLTFLRNIINKKPQ